MATSEAYIKIGGPDHLLYLAGLFFLIYMLFTRKEWIRKRKNAFDKGLLLIVFLQQLLLYGSYYIYMDFDLSESLPLHICRICSILLMVFLATKNTKVFELVAYFGLFALLSFVYPSKVYGLNHPIGYSFFISHATNLLAACYGILIHRIKLKPASQNRAFLVFLLYYAIVLVVNPLVDGNYFYMKHKPVLAGLSNFVYVPMVSLATYFFFYLGSRVYNFVQNSLMEKTPTIWDILTN